jgi:hypothetical protein
MDAVVGVNLTAGEAVLLGDILARQLYNYERNHELDKARLVSRMLKELGMFSADSSPVSP